MNENEAMVQAMIDADEPRVISLDQRRAQLARDAYYKRQEAARYARAKATERHRQDRRFRSHVRLMAFIIGVTVVVALVLLWS